MEKKQASIEMTVAKQTVNKVVFSAVPTGSAPVVESIYIPKWWAEGVKKIRLTIESVE